ncbi:hypothetical protein PGUG_02462 [Meyerozyma guilliermondii ATCC 6260]|uniref:Serine/threonine-protein kinase SCH9 n=1 Tax=Meyerozyma guilliermondii (strain ATCC 6260 / CBS 566 / DSM 6381 / JCM 1539 / NBRC 10279 / NRRL Y-324) TaxID=294746 RepID=A5DGR1_PICGU|nr:uncharacterized protein PGUG_02462 [Meyerozyma guilliermondii ATCC 6260]EDK38364.2 hypothetical protein PGUG_02462 [Meyerozyma guilliermondii ATCC 6260]
MPDFPKSFFHFSGFQKKSQSPTPEMNHSDGTESAFNSKLLPKGLSSAAPTTALSDNSLAYGTTSSHAGHETASERFLYQTRTVGDLQHNYSNSSLMNELHDAPVSGQETSYATSNASSQDQEMTDSSSQPIIITTDERGQNRRPASKNSSQPKGRLKVSIIEAHGLLVSSNGSQPYVVCTFESSEFISHGPHSYNNSPGFKVPDNTYQHAPVPVAKSQKEGSRPTLYQRQSSSQQMNFGFTQSDSSNPIWNHEATFDVVGSRSELDVSVYDAARDDAFLGHVRIFPSTIGSEAHQKPQLLNLRPRIVGERVDGQIRVEWRYKSSDKKSCTPDDFEVLRLLGKGTFGQVFQVKKKDTDRIYAMKVLSKKVIVKKKEIAHTIGERDILVRTSAAASPFIVGLKFSFQTPTDLYLVTDYMSGGELFWHLQKEGRFTEDRAKFYIAELVLALEHLHDNDIVYRDLKPENILLDANGHIALCDFGLSKANLNNDGTTNTFCGTTEYLAPEVLLDESGYTKMVDFWSLGVLIFEMCCGWSPFYADNTQQMYKNIAFGKVRFPKEVLSSEGRSFVKGLLNRNPKHRLGAVNDAKELRAHAFFQDIDWDLLRAKSIPPPFKPHLTSETDTSNFDPEFTSESTSVLRKNLELATTPLSPGIQAKFKGFTYVDDSAMEDHFGKSHRMNTFQPPGSFIPGNPNLPPDEDVIDDDHIEEEPEEKMQIDDEMHQMDDVEFVNGRFDL